MRTLILSLFVLCMSLSTYAQPDRREKIKALKVSFITEKLELSESEAQKFWPVYNSHEERTSRIKHRELRGIIKKIKESSSTLSDEESQALLDKLISAEKRLHKANTQLIDKLKEILPPKKIILLRVAEEDFKRKLFEELKKKRQSNRNN